MRGLMLAVLATSASAGAPLQPEADEASICLVQHDDRTPSELSSEEAALTASNMHICSREPLCRHVMSTVSFDETVEPHWQKLLAVRSALQSGCRHAVWLDSDVTVHTSTPLKLLDSFEGRPVFACSDPPPDLTPRFFGPRNPFNKPAPMNAGIWGVANTPSGLALLNAWIGLYPAHLWSVDHRKDVNDCVQTRPRGTVPKALHLAASPSAASAELGSTVSPPRFRQLAQVAHARYKQRLLADKQAHKAEAPQQQPKPPAAKPVACQKNVTNYVRANRPCDKL